MSHKPLLILGDTWTREEAEARQSFTGTVGKILHTTLAYAGIPREDCYFTHCFLLQPRPTNDIIHLCGKKAEGIPGLPPAKAGKYIRVEYASHIERLEKEIAIVKPNLIVALDNVSLSVVMRQWLPISKNRGNLFQSKTGQKVLATFSPSSIMRDWSLRPIVNADFLKAKRHYTSPAFTRPAREVWVEPSLEDIETFYLKHMLPRLDEPWGVDIETSNGTITEIGFGRPDIALVIPFYSRANSSHNYWDTELQEFLAWKRVERILDELLCPVFQNGLYDINYLWRTMGLRVRHADEDTMLLAHALQPEMKKGLGFLGSIYTDEPSWKMMRKDNQTLKKEDD